VNIDAETMSVPRFPSIVTDLKGIRERFMQALSCIGRCFVWDDTPEHSVGAVERAQDERGRHRFQKPRMPRAAEGILALSWHPRGFTSSGLADRVTGSSR
jgi:hypothetical protein